jgi:predicted nucleic acid-binding protein
MRAYCDTSVLVDLLVDGEVGRRARAHLNEWQGRATLVSSRLTTVELGRVAVRDGHLVHGTRFTPMSLPLEYVSLGEPILQRAGSLPVRFLRSLDAIHIASALIARCDVVLTRDRQMAHVCEELGLRVG